MKTHKNAQYSGISVVIPCLNEEQSIGQVVDAAFQGIRQTGLTGEVIVVDNDSSDNSAGIARDHGATVIFEAEKGYGSALRKGFSEAKYDIIVMGDGDLTYDFSKLDILVNPVLEGKADFVVGNRMKDIRPGAMPKLHQYLGNPLLSFLLKAFFHTRAVHDAQCGMRAITKTAYENLYCVTTGMEFASEMIIHALRIGLKIEERNITYHPRVGESKLSSFKDGWRHLRFMLLYSPSAALLVPGFFVWTVSMLIAFPLAFGHVIIYGHSIDIHCMILAGLMNIISIQFISAGLLAKAYAHLSGLRTDPVIAWLYKRFTFEKIMLATLPLILFGIIVTLKVIIQWIAEDFGAPNEARLLFFALLCLTNGAQIATGGYLFSIMALPRHIEPFPKEDKRR
ncbi:MAG: glycosyltransferase [Candidatus Theseobacter exili]|nr:glycosyltransferase [Candidatus Theseobacter exili]